MTEFSIDKTIGSGLLDVATRLLDGPEEDLTTSQLRRAASSLYYALFHTLSLHFANTLIGNDPTGGLARAWVEVYRAMEHKNCAHSCRELATRNFPKKIKLLAADMLQLYEARLSADYDPTYIIDIVTLNSLYGLTIKNIEMLGAADDRDIRALASWMLFHASGSKLARINRQPIKEA